MSAVNAASLEVYRERGALLSPGTRIQRPELIRRLGKLGRLLKCRFEDFKSAEQELVVYKALEGEDVLAVMPTGSGKSLTYQLTAFLRPKELTLVVSPLKALIAQQDEFLPFGVGLTSDTLDRQAVWDSLLRGTDHVLFVSPEMLSGQKFQQILAKNLRRGRLKLGRFVVDEVHCLSDWGHDFRPHYWWVSHYLRELEAHMPRDTKAAQRVPRLLLTATADEQVLTDIRRHFPEIEDEEVVRGAVARPELVLGSRRVSSSSERLAQLAKFVRHQAERELPAGTARRGIVFTLEAVSKVEDGEEGKLLRERKKTDRLKADHIVDFLKRKGFRHTYPYSSKGMHRYEREASRQAFEKAPSRRGHVTVVVATNAFGMGMDYPQVPFVAHVYPRPSISEYWQQVGRAGRGFDSHTWAECLALFSRGDQRYAARFAKAPALDGLINAFTMPLHGWMYVWKQDGGHMSLKGGTGGRTRFSRLLEELQAMGVVGTRAHKVAWPRRTVRFRINLKRLRRPGVVDSLNALQDDRFSTKRLRKVFRYLRIAAISKKRSYVLLDRWEYDHDRQGSVLQRLNRWVDTGCLRLNPKATGTGTMRLDLVRRQLSDRILRQISKEAEQWGRHKQQTLVDAMNVLKVGSPQRRQREVLRYFGDPAAGSFNQREVLRSVPKWLRTNH